MFNKDWYLPKNKSKELTVGWLYNKQIDDPFAEGYTRNMLDYWSVEFSWFLPEQFEADNIGDLLKKAHAAGFKKMVVFKQGTVLRQFIQEFPTFYEATKNVPFVGHILDQQDSYYTIHPQAFIIDLTWWESVGFPEWGQQDRHSLEESFETIEPIRSAENWHDEYTPHWIAPGTTSRTYKRKLGGSNMVRALIEDGKQIISWNKEMREEKAYTYPEIVVGAPRHIPAVLEQLGMDIFFIANTELPPDYTQWINRRKLQYPEWDGTFNRLVVPAAGLSALIYAFILGMPKNGKIFVYDISKFGLEMTKRIIQEWDGKDYSKFAQRLMREIAPEPSRRRDIFRGSAQLGDSDNTINKLAEQGFIKWLEEVLPTLEIFYNPVNIMDPNKSKKFVKTAKNERDVTYIHLSNIYHYLPTSFYYNLQQRWALHNELINSYKDVSDNNNLFIYSACPVGYHSRINWADDWNQIPFSELPDNNIGKLLKWNKPPYKN